MFTVTICLLNSVYQHVCLWLLKVWGQLCSFKASQSNVQHIKKQRHIAFKDCALLQLKAEKVQGSFWWCEYFLRLLTIAVFRGSRSLWNTHPCDTGKVTLVLPDWKMNTHNIKYAHEYRHKKPAVFILHPSHIQLRLGLSTGSIDFLDLLQLHNSSDIKIVSHTHTQTEHTMWNMSQFTFFVVTLDTQSQHWSALSFFTSPFFFFQTLVLYESFSPC